jgi:hypothetical protein
MKHPKKCRFMTKTILIEITPIGRRFTQKNFGFWVWVWVYIPNPNPKGMGFFEYLGMGMGMGFFKYLGMGFG